MKGTMLDFLRFVGEKPQFAKELVKLAAEHGFEFTQGQLSGAELSDSQLESVAGGTGLPSKGDDAQLADIDLQNALQQQQHLLQMLSSVSKVLSDTAGSIVRKIG